MDSRLIFSATLYKKGKVEWANTTHENGAWVYIGSGSELRKDIVFNAIDVHFTSQTLYVVLTKKKSIEVKKQDIQKAISHILGIDDFLIWDTNFKKVIEFNKISVMRLGEIPK